MANLHLITGYSGAAHITAADHGSFNAAILTSGNYVLDKGNKLSASAIDYNVVRVMDGDILMQGRHIRLNDGAYIDLTVENGEQGMLRNDLIVCRYSKVESTSVEEANLVVIKGTSAASDPVDPAYVNGDLLINHDLIVDMPLYRVSLSGLEIISVTPLFETLDVLEDTLNDLKTNKQDEITLLPYDANPDIADMFPYRDVSAEKNKHITWNDMINNIAKVVTPEGGKLTKKVVLTESCTWTVPVSGLYRIMVIGGGGGGGAGMSLYNSGWDLTTQHFSGAGGSASKPVCGEFVLAAGIECEVVVGAGGAGRSTRTYTESDTTPTFSAVDAEASEGGESSVMYGGTLLLQSDASSRISGGEYKKSTPGKYSSAYNIYSGASGAGYSAGAISDYVNTADIATTKTIAGATNPNGGGKGADYSYDLITGGSTNHGEAGKTFGMGGGGGCMLGWIKSTGSSNIKTFVSRGGDGGSGAVIIEWIEE